MLWNLIARKYKNQLKQLKLIILYKMVHHWSWKINGTSGVQGRVKMKLRTWALSLAKACEVIHAYN